MSVGRAKCVCVVARDPRRADRLHQLLAVARELVERVRAVVHEPHVAIRVVRADDDAVRPHEQLVVLFPRLDQPPVAVDDIHDVIPARMACRILLREIEPGGIARRGQIARVLQAREAPARKDDDAVRRFRPDAGRRADDMAVAAPVLRPPGDELVFPGNIPAALLRLRLYDAAGRQEDDDCRESRAELFHGKPLSIRRPEL